MHAIEALIADHEEIRAKIFNKKAMSKILLKFYDEDIVEEESFYTWHEKASKRFADKAKAKEIREMANEFIQWLRTAEESSDEDDEDEDKLPEPQVKKREGVSVVVRWLCLFFRLTLVIQLEVVSK